MVRVCTSSFNPNLGCQTQRLIRKSKVSQVVRKRLAADQLSDLGHQTPLASIVLICNMGSSSSGTIQWYLITGLLQGFGDLVHAK